MKTFKDNADRTWTVEINVDAIKRVRDLVDLDLLAAAAGGGAVIQKLAGDPILLCDVVYVLCKPQAEKLSVSDEEFGRAMAGDAIAEATSAVLEELVRFFPKGQQRDLLAKALRKLEKLEAMVFAATTEKLDSDEMEQEMSQILQDLPKNSSGGLEASSPSIPDP